MRIEYDSSHDVLNIEFLAKVAIDDAVEIDGIIIDYAKDRTIVSIEVLDASRRTTLDPKDLSRLAVVRTVKGRADVASEPKAPYRHLKKKRRQ